MRHLQRFGRGPLWRGQVFRGSLCLHRCRRQWGSPQHCLGIRTSCLKGKLFFGCLVAKVMLYFKSQDFLFLFPFWAGARKSRVSSATVHTFDFIFTDVCYMVSTTALSTRFSAAAVSGTMPETLAAETPLRIRDERADSTVQVPCLHGGWKSMKFKSEYQMAGWFFLSVTF